MPLKVAILASGNGSNAQAIFDNMKCGKLDIEVVLVISNRPDAKVLDRAKAASIPILSLDHTTFASREEFDIAMIQSLKEAQAELIVLAGYMRILSTIFLNSFSGKVINLHPAILPSFKGAHAISDAHNLRVKLTGCTVHFVNEELDSGAIIIQAAIPVLANEALCGLENRIHKIEHQIYPQAIEWIAKGRVKLVNEQVNFIPAHESCAKNNMHTINISDEHSYLIWPPLENIF